MVGKSLVGSLGIRLVDELDEDGVNSWVLAGAISRLSGIGIWDKMLELLSAPVDSINLGAKQAELAKLVGWALLWSDPASSHGARFGIGSSIGDLLVVCVAALHGLGARFEGSLDELGLSLLEAESSLVALLDELVNVIGLACDPDPLDLLAKDLAKLVLIKVRRWHRCEKNGAGRNAVGVDWAKEESLAQVDVKDALAADHDHDKTKEDPSHKRVREHAMPVARFLFIQVSECEEVETRIAVAASRVDCKEDWPGNQRTKEGDSRADTNEAQEEVCIERLVLERVGIWDLPEGAEPVEEACWKSWGSLSEALLAIVRQSGFKTTYFSRRVPR